MNDELRRLSPDDLRAAAITGPAGKSLKTPAGWRASSQSSASKTPACEQCADAGYYLLAVPYGHPQFAQLQKCDCAAYARQIAPTVARLGDELGALAGRTFESFNLDRPLMPVVWHGEALGVQAQRTAIETAHRRARAYADSPRGWLYIHGSFGAGKSHLAAAIANAQPPGSARFLTVGKLLDTLTAAARDKTIDQLMAELIDCHLLILDELAQPHLAEAASDWRFGRIERLVNERLDRPTVITSNVAPDDLAAPGDVRGERVADRIVGASRLVWLPVSSYRRIEAAS